MNTLLIILFIIHVIVCLVCFLLTWLGILKCRLIDVLVLFFIPLFGLISLLMRSRVYRETERAANELQMLKLTVDDDVRRSIDMGGLEETDDVVSLSDAFVVNDSKIARQMVKESMYDISNETILKDDEEEIEIVPLQEALIVNDSQTKREIIMDVLYTNPSGYINQLSTAKSNDDTEVVHYAVTALVELQKEYDLQFQAIGRELAVEPDSEQLLGKYQRLLEKYLSSGLAQGAARISYLNKYIEVLGQRIEMNPDVLSLWLKKADADLVLGRYEELIADADTMVNIRPENEQGYMYQIKYYAVKKDRRGIDEVIKTMKRRNVYVSAAARKEIDFWTGGNN